MAFEMLVALHVVDGESYQSSRDKMIPILQSYGGGFGYDFMASNVLRSRTDAPINRVFTIYFLNEGAKDSFFSNSHHLKVRQRHFDQSVTDTMIIVTHER